MIRRLEVEYREDAQNNLADIFRLIVETGGNLDVALKSFCASKIDVKTSAMHRVAAGRAATLRQDCERCRSSTRLSPAYVVDDDVVRIVNIFYGGRDYETLMRDGGSSDPS